jgi:hypothetical protein
MHSLTFESLLKTQLTAIPVIVATSIYSTYLGSPQWYCKNRVGWFRAFLILLARLLIFVCACARLRVCAHVNEFLFFNDAFNYEDMPRTVVPNVCSTDPLETTTIYE